MPPRARALLFFSAFAAACGGSTSPAPRDAGPPQEAGETPDGSALCHLDPPGPMFTFHVHNGGTRTLALAYGCGASYPVTLTTLQGALGIGPGPANTCEFTCDYVYSPMAATACSDCGPGVGAMLPPGATVDIPWDRRVYEEITADPSCTHGNGPQGCALGIAVGGATMQAGTLTVCTSPPQLAGNCQATQMFPFTLDTTQTSGTIGVK